MQRVQVKEENINDDKWKVPHFQKEQYKHPIICKTLEEPNPSISSTSNSAEDI